MSGEWETAFLERGKLGTAHLALREIHLRIGPVERGPIIIEESLLLASLLGKIFHLK